MNLDMVGFFGQLDHKPCKTDICHVDWIKTLDEHLNLYLDALSKVFFKKENMRIKETWWLSTFYSFAIQGLVRKLIWDVAWTLAYPMPRKQYLHLAIRLFIASSGDYDPLMRDYASSSKGKETDSSCVADLEEAKTAVEQDSWASKGILSSADYLRKLFEDDGKSIISKGDSASVSTFPTTLLPSGDEGGENEDSRWDGKCSPKNGTNTGRSRRIASPKDHFANPFSVSAQFSPFLC